MELTHENKATVDSKAAIEALSAYEVIAHEYLPDVGSDSWLLRHKKTGARAALLPKDDNNKVFYIAFRTPPEDSTGVAHIIEHTVLCGSRDFPVKDPFIELAKGSLNTFLNAMTYPDKTVYPVASCNEQDFKNLMHVYLDAVFYPNIYKEQNIFRQEGWHYEADSADSEIKVNGVVYNEMKGALSQADDILGREINAVLYPHTPYQHESGGDPVNIPDLTYDYYLDFHRRYYHPSNSYIYLYGDMDMAERLTWIDENYLSKFDRLDIDSSIPVEPAFDAPVEAHCTYSILPEEDPAGKSYLSWNLAVLPDSLDVGRIMAIKILNYALCDAEGAPVRKALRDKGLGEDVYTMFESGIRQPFYSIVSKYTDPGRKDEFVSTIRDTLAKIAVEKAGIIKERVPVVIGESHPETRPVFEAIAAERNAPIVFADDIYRVKVGLGSYLGRLNFDIERLGKPLMTNLVSPLAGSYQVKNIATLFAAIEAINHQGRYHIDPVAIKCGIESVVAKTGLHGRWEIMAEKPLVVCETAHNADGVNAMLDKLSTMNYKKLHIVYGCVNDKDFSAILRLLPTEATYYYTQPSVPRRMPVEQLASAAATMGMGGKAYPDVLQAVKAARLEATPDDMILITGSIFLVADAMSVRDQL